MKKILSLFLATTLLCCLAGCKKDSDTPYDYDLSEYIRMPDYTAVQAEYDDPNVCTEEEIDDAIFQVMLTYAIFTEEEGRKAEPYDKVDLSYYCYLDGQVVEDLTEADTAIVIGQKTGDALKETIGDALIGAAANETVFTEYTFPDDDYYYGSYAGKTLQIETEVIRVSAAAVPECDDEFVASLEGYDFQTVADFRAVVREDILQQKLDNKMYAVWNAFCREVEVLKYPEPELEQYRQSYLEKYESTAAQYGVELEEFLTTYLQTDYDTFQADMQAYAEESVKTDMIFIQLSRLMNITISDEEYQAGVEEYYASAQAEFDSLEEFIEEYGEDVLRENLVWDKVLMQLVDSAKP